MIDLFVSDIDGCLAEPYAAYDLDGFQALAERAARDDAAGPALSLCSGRPYSYVEAVTQALGLTTPVLFESGGGCFDPVAAETRWHPRFTDALDEQMQAVRRWMTQDLVPGTRGSVDHGKRTQAGVVTPDSGEVPALRRRVEAFVASEGLEVRVFQTDNSVDVVAPGITKREGLAWLGDRLDVSLEAMAYIGDTEGDLDALEAAGYAFAPRNAAAAVREAVSHVTDGAVIDGTLEAYDRCTAHNRSAPSPTPDAHAARRE
jgi:hypothetical protein